MDGEMTDVKDIFSSGEWFSPDYSKKDEPATEPVAWSPPEDVVLWARDELQKSYAETDLKDELFDYVNLLDFYSQSQNMVESLLAKIESLQDELTLAVEKEAEAQADNDQLRKARYLVPGFEDGVALANGNTDQALNVSAELVKKLSDAVAEVAELRADNKHLRENLTTEGE